ncbi:hypothetical protein JB92DRAFT_3042195 [Gautieria morchelliformis]|nr:hypothetical protein JB92DRAFT_3042195 [Gautieria morchelliformis]
MHKHHCAHRDCTGRNIMMDARKLFPRGFHPINIDIDYKHDRYARHWTRTERPPKYLLIDFGLSRFYDPKHGPPLDLPVRGIDRTAPEPSKQPSIDQVMTRFEAMYRSLSFKLLRTHIGASVFYDFLHFFRRMRYAFMRIPPVPRAVLKVLSSSPAGNATPICCNPCPMGVAKEQFINMLDHQTHMQVAHSKCKCLL